MNVIPVVFKAVSLTFTGLALWTGAKGFFRPISFAADFGLPLDPYSQDMARSGPGNHEKQEQQQYQGPATTSNPTRSTAQAYIRLMSIRQLATGITLAIFAQQGKWDEMASILAVIGVVVAGTDGYFLATVAARRDLGVFHALPGGIIAVLSMVFLCR